MDILRDYDTGGTGFKNDEWHCNVCHTLCEKTSDIRYYDVTNYNLALCKQCWSDVAHKIGKDELQDESNMSRFLWTLTVLFADRATRDTKLIYSVEAVRLMESFYVPSDSREYIKGF